jgi:hypothetical protein
MTRQNADGEYVRSGGAPQCHTSLVVDRADRDQRRRVGLEKPSMRFWRVLRICVMLCVVGAILHRRQRHFGGCHGAPLRAPLI